MASIAQAKQAEAEVGIFEAGIGVDRERFGELGAKLRFVEERVAKLPMWRGCAIPQDTGAMRKQLGNRDGRDGGVEAFDILTDLVIEMQASVASVQLHDPDRRESLGMRGDAKTVFGGKWGLGLEVGDAVSALEDEFAVLCDRQYAAWKFGYLHLGIRPLLGIAESIFEPFES